PASVTVPSVAGGFSLELDVLAKSVTSFAGDYNGNGRVDAADYAVWRDMAGAESIVPYTGADGTGDGRVDEADLTLWRSRYGATVDVVIASASAEIGTTALFTGSDGAIGYSAPQYFVGTDVIRYTLRDLASGRTFSSQVTVHAVGDNVEQDPVAVAELATQAAAMVAEPRVFDTFVSTAVGQTLAGSGLVGSFLFAADRVISRLSSGPQHGTLELNYDGTYSYTPRPGFVGSDAFQYEVFDGFNSIEAVASIEVLPELEYTRQRLSEIGLAMDIYESSFDRFPLSSTFDDDGNRLLSWRVHLLPFLGYQDLYERFHLDEPWDSPNNLPLVAEMPADFRSAGDTPDSVTTRFQTFNGPEAPFGRLPDSEPQQGTRLAEFTDGLQNTVLVVESEANAAVVWAKPEDLVFDPADPLKNLGPGPISSVMADGSVVTVSGDVSDEDYAALVTLRGEEIVDAQTLQRAHYQGLGNPLPVHRLSTEEGSLKTLALAALNYHDVHASFPIRGSRWFDEDGLPYLSWRVHLLPFLGYDNLYARFNLDEPWDSPNNLPLLAEMPDLFRGPDDAADITTTRYLRFTGPEAPFEYTGGFPQRGPSLRSIVDGISRTLHIVEVAADRAVPWTKPEDVPFDRSDPLGAMDTTSPINVVFFDGFHATLPPDILPSDFAALVTRNGRELFNLSTLLADDDENEEPRSRETDQKQIVLGLLNYESAFARFPQDRVSSDGTPLLSWRVELLRYIGEESLYDTFRRDEPWDSPHNLSLLQYMPDVFRSLDDPADSTTTSVFRFVGPDTPYQYTPESDEIRLLFRDITDGTSNTIATIDAGPEAAVPWTKPADLPLGANPFGPLGNLGEEFVAAFFDGHVETLSSGMSASGLRALITPAGGEVRDDPPPIVVPPGISVVGAGDGITTNEFGVAVVQVVLDTQPTGTVVVGGLTSDAGVATIDAPPLLFDQKNWDTPQPIAVRAVDNAVSNADRTVSVTIVAASFTDASYNGFFAAPVEVTVFDDEPRQPDLPGDFNRDGLVNAADYGLWRDQAGPSVLQPFRGADSNGDGQVDETDRAMWRSQYGSTAVLASAATVQPESPIIAALEVPVRPERPRYRVAIRQPLESTANDRALLLLGNDAVTLPSVDDAESSAASRESDDAKEVVLAALSDFFA
ncbi:MAG: DUF1559 domain-containing protein, partial [Planctomycetota bacterium]